MSSFKRCSICDYCFIQEPLGSAARKFRYDHKTGEFHCSHCSAAIHDNLVGELQEIPEVDPAVDFAEQAPYWFPADHEYRDSWVKKEDVDE